VPSSVIRSFAYEGGSRSLVITFVSGRRYRYHEVPTEVHEAMRLAFAKGEFFNKQIRDHFRYSEENGAV
jgi:hypothetical protein